MRKLLFIIGLFFLSIPAFAEDLDYSFSAEVCVGDSYYGASQWYYTRLKRGTKWRPKVDKNNLASMYEGWVSGYDTDGVFGLEFNWHYNKVLALGLSASYSKVSLRYTSWKDSPHKETYSLTYITPSVKVYALNHNHVKLYGATRAGAELKYLHRGKSDGIMFISPCLEIAPVGVEWAGERIFGYNELLLGKRILLISFGVGCRF